MKTTLEIEDGTLRRAKIMAAERGITLKELFNQALAEKVQKSSGAKKTPPAWLKLAGAFGKTAADRADTRRIQSEIDRSEKTIQSERCRAMAIGALIKILHEELNHTNSLSVIP